MNRRHFIALGTAALAGAPPASRTVRGAEQDAPPATSVDGGPGTPRPRHPRLLEESGRHWILDAEGSRLFALGLALQGGRRRPRRRGAAAGTDADGGVRPDSASVSAGLARLGLNAIQGPGRRIGGLQGITRIVTLDLAPVSAALTPERISFPDVFDAAVQERLAERIRSTSRRHADDPSVIGFSFVQDPLWDGRRAREMTGTDWVGAIRSLGRESAGKRAYVDYLKERYTGAGTVATFYRTKAKDWDELLDDPFDDVPVRHGVVESNDRDFRKQVAAKFYELVGSAVRAAAPGHLNFGDRFAFREHPPEVLEAAREHIDVFTIGFPAQPEYTRFYFDLVRRLVGRPVLLVTQWPSEPPPGPAAAADSGVPSSAPWQPWIDFYREAAGDPSVVGLQASIEGEHGDGTGLVSRVADLAGSDTGEQASLPPLWEALAEAGRAARGVVSPAAG